MADTKISALTHTAGMASTDRIPSAYSPFASGNNAYWTPPDLATLFGTTLALPLTTGVTGILPGANGGTGVANTGFTLTLAGTSSLSILTNPSGAILQLGAADAASPVAQTLQAQSVVGGTSNVAGATTTFRGSLGTGTGAPGALNFAIGSSGNSTATTQNAAATLLSLVTQSNQGSDATNNILITPTWNTSGSVTAVLLNITNTASGGSSKYIDFQLGGNTRFNINSSGQVNIYDSGSNIISTWGGAASTALRFTNTAIIGFCSGAANASGADTILTRFAAATLQFGSTDSASPVAQTLRFQGTSTTNTAGVNATVIGSLSAGSGNSGDIIFQTGVKSGSSGVQATATTALTIKGETQAINAAGVVNVAAGTATPAAGSTAARLLFGTTAGFGIYYGSAAPTVSAAQGSLYLRSDGSATNNRAYINTDGGTTWTAITTGA